MKSDTTLAIFVGVLLAILVAFVLVGRTDDLRRGVRMLFGGGGEDQEPYTPLRLEDYGGSDGDEDED